MDSTNPKSNLFLIKRQIARWLSVDPLADKYPGWSPYNYTLNNPLKYIDPNGMYSAETQDGSEKEEDEDVEAMRKAKKEKDKASFGSSFLNFFKDLFSFISEEEEEEERIRNHGLTNQQKAKVKFYAFESFISIMAKSQITATASTLNLTGMGTTGRLLPTTFFAFASGTTGLGGDLYDSKLNGNQITTNTFSSFGLGMILSAGAYFTPAPVDKFIGAANMGLGIGLMPFNNENQKWNQIRTMGF